MVAVKHIKNIFAVMRKSNSSDETSSKKNEGKMLSDIQDTVCCLRIIKHDFVPKLLDCCMHASKFYIKYLDILINYPGYPHRIIN